MNKVVKLQIIKPENIEWDILNKILYTLQKETREIMNKTISYLWEFQDFCSDYKKVHEVYPKDKEILNKSLAGYVYDKLKNNTLLYSSNFSQSQQRAIKRWKTDIKDILLGEKTIPTFKKDNLIDLHNKSINIIKENYEYYAEIKLLNKKGVSEFNLESSTVKVLISCCDNSTKTILNRIISGEYKIGGSQILKHKHKNKWFINLTYQFEPSKKQLDENTILGIDMGIVYPVYMAINNSLKREKIIGGEIEAFRKKIEARRISMLQQGKYCGKGRRGHGRKTRIKPIEKLSEKIKNFRNTCNHKYSRFIVDFAVKNNCGTIQMEDLSGIASDEKKATFLGNWTYYDLQQKIKYKAEEKGIKVVLINPRYTSQRCSKCGFIHKDNRENQKIFKCKNCGFETNADYNAAKNIATKNIENIIEEQLKKQEEKFKNELIMSY